MATSKRFVQSEPFVPSKPGEPVTWLKAKYRSPKAVSKGKTSPGGNSGKKKNQRPLTPQERALHAAQPRKVKVVYANGKARMVTV